MVARLCRHFRLSKWDCFRAVYYYSMCYNLVDPWKMLTTKTPISKNDIDFVTDRRYVRCGDDYERLLRQLTPHLFVSLSVCNSTREQYRLVSGWYYFGRYASYLFLEVWNYLFPAKTDDFIPAWERKELYTKATVELSGGSYDLERLNAFISRAKSDTGDTAFSLETSLCGWAKMGKGTRYDGYYTDRMLSYTAGTAVGDIVLRLYAEGAGK